MSTYTKVSNQKIIEACSEKIYKILFERSLKILEKERKAFLYINPVSHFMIKYKIKRKIKYNYSTRYHKNNRNNFIKMAKKFFDRKIHILDLFIDYRDDFPSEALNFLRNILKLALFSDNGYIMLSLKDIRNFDYLDFDYLDFSPLGSEFKPPIPLDDLLTKEYIEPTDKIWRIVEAYENDLKSGKFSNEPDWIKDVYDFSNFISEPEKIS